jgi:acetyl-CoA C-acetyltransferase
MRVKNEIWIASGLRTPFAKADKELKNVSALEMSKEVLNKMYENGNPNPNYVIWGSVVPTLKYSNIAREAVMDSNLKEETISFSTVLACSSSLLAAIEACSMISEDEIAIAGGVESFSNVQIGLNDKSSDWIKKIGVAKSFMDKLKLIFGFFSLRIQSPQRVNRSTGKSMGEHAEITGQLLGIEKKKQDEIAVASHHNYYKAKENGFYDDLFFPAYGLSKDTIPRKDTSVEKIAHLKPVFDFSGNGTITAGNSSLFTDGAAGVWIAGKNMIDKINSPYKARFLDWELAGVNIEQEGILMAPTVAIPKLLERNNLKYDDIDLWEIHEAFASQVLATIVKIEDKKHIKKLGINFDFGKFPLEKLNPNGSSIAIGHPFGATGARILSQTVKHLHNLGTNKKAIISVCADGGLGAVVLVGN